MLNEGGRWQNYHLTRGDEVASFWSSHLGERARNVLLIASQGMDPRTALVPQMLKAAGGEGRRDSLLLTYRSGAVTGGDPVADAALRALTDGRGAITSQAVDMYSRDGRRVASQRAADVVGDVSVLVPYDDVVIDVSGMPRGVFFPLVARVLYLLDGLEDKAKTRNLFLLVAENPLLDASIQPTGIEEAAGFVAGFRGTFDQEHEAELPAIWLPILGEARGKQLDLIFEQVKPKETSPVLPSPARNPRRADNLVVEHREFLFGALGLDPRDFMYAAEDNPFEVYRRLRAAVLRYDNALQSIGGCRVAFSALSSKLMSIGALLAAYELKVAPDGPKVAVAHVDSHGYEGDGAAAESELFSLWIAGECYDPA